MFEPKFPSLPAELAQLKLTGRATDSQFAQNPLPLARALGIGLAGFHSSTVPEGLEPRTPAETDNALRWLDSEDPLPAPFTRVSHAAVRSQLSTPPTVSAPVVTHGAPIVANVTLDNSVAHFDESDVLGFDPPERDLSIAIRSISETFTGEVAITFLDAYVEAGGGQPLGLALDWYGVLAAFR